MKKDLTAYQIRVYGIVQGVGFRPFAARLARKCGIAGTVCNKGSFVEITAEGTDEAVRAFLRGLTKEAPQRAVILKTEARKQSPLGVSSFRIVRSERIRGDIFVSPDLATCPQCRKELFDPADRRYLHPFINCTDCGPRVTILDAMPYDRVRTSMKAFPMCDACTQEYTTPKTRRYHAQPVCCNDCGPELHGTFSAVNGHSEQLTGAAALLRTREIIRQGGIAAVKGIGGFHLCADACCEEAVKRLRRLKNRPFKPFAVMMRDLDTVRRYCYVTEEQEAVLDGPARPILLLRRRQGDTDPTGGVSGSGKPEPAECQGQFRKLAQAAAPDNPYIGVMLPYAPVQMLLFSWPDGEPMPDALIMTSGNASDTPICINDEEAEQFLTPLCDCILSNDRPIRLRADDSVMNWFDGEPYMIRRSRGYAPMPVMISSDSQKEAGIEMARPEDAGRGAAVREAAAGTILGIGGELKNVFCLAKESLLYLSPYIGNLTDVRGTDALEQAVTRMEELLEIRPEQIVCDLHPQYRSAKLAEQLAAARGIPLIRLQHHYAHVLSCMAENDETEPVIGIAFDGTGYGTDGTVWGGEFLIADRRGFTRAGSLEPFPQTGGDLAPREGWRIAAALLGQDDTPGGTPEPSGGSWKIGPTGEKIGIEPVDPADFIQRLGLCSPQEYRIVEAMIRSNINCITSTSAGRLFDAASAVLGLRRTSTSEGEASMVLQFAAEAWCEAYPDQIAGSVPSQNVWMDSMQDSGRCSDEKPDRIPNPDRSEPFRLPVRPLIRTLAERRLAGEDTGKLAYEFHQSIAELILTGALKCRQQSGLLTVALTGGVMQNTLLMQLTVPLLEDAGFRVLRHRLIPPNDGGISLGQAYYRGEEMT